MCIWISTAILNAVVLENQPSLRREKAWSACSLPPSTWSCCQWQWFVSVKAIGEEHRALCSSCSKMMTSLLQPPEGTHHLFHVLIYTQELLVTGLKLMNPYPGEVRSSRIIHFSLISSRRKRGSALSPPLLSSPLLGGWMNGIPRRMPGFQRAIKMLLDLTACHHSFTMMINHLLRLDSALGTELCSLLPFSYLTLTATP